MTQPDSQKVYIFDTTLRDGQQCPGAGMSFERNIEYFRLTCALGIDVVEAGFPSASQLDFEIVHAIAEECVKQTHQPMVAALCQLREEQVRKTISALEPVIPIGKGRLHTYVPVDPELLEASLGGHAADKGKIVDDVYRLVKMAHDAGLEVQFSPEGYSRMRENFDFTTDLIRAAVAGGARVINCPDTIGGASTFEGSEYFVEKMKQHAAIIASEFPDKEVIWSVHCHNDLGLAVQNSINGVFDGPARQIEGCINGIGERAGNASLEQCIMILRQFGSSTNRNVNSQAEQTPFHCDARLDVIQEISDFVNKHMLPRQPHWPVTGENAARHSSGGHTNAILKNPMAYQPFDPRAIGKNITFAFGPLSGGNHARSIIESNGYKCDDDEKAKIAQFIKDKSADRRKGISDRELMRIYVEYRQPMNIETVNYGREGDRSSVTILGEFFGDQGQFSCDNSGKDSALAALKTLIESRFGPVKIITHSSRSDSQGINAKSVSQIIVQLEDGSQFEGTAQDHDLEISAMRALIDAVNKAHVYRQYAFDAEKNRENQTFVHAPQATVQQAS
jgi:2-isopropylmalate synthase